MMILTRAREINQTPSSMDFCLVLCYIQFLIMNFASTILKMLFVPSIQHSYPNDSILTSVLLRVRVPARPSGI
jgi:ACR3 family arsenite efflux pump ArsB